MNTVKCDVLIGGGGLAGLTLALQLRASDPDLDIVLLERRQAEPPLAAHKVGESTIEIGAHYLAHTLALRPLLERTQLRKFGLRFFFGAQSKDLSEADELGASGFFPIPTYQLDRGQLERDLFDLAVEQGVDARRGSFVHGVSELDSGAGQQVSFRDQQGEHTAQCRWFVDASGRAAVLKRLRSMQRPPRHSISSAWFRMDGAIDVDQWSSNQEWINRCNGTGRLLSTNHLMGPGYWAWIIPLPNQRTSVGLVADSNIVPLDGFKSFDRFQAWADTNQPLLANALEACGDSPMDFRHLSNLACDSNQVWSADGWAMTGESGVFSDPFYSPGTDYIAIANTFITDFVTDRKSKTTERSKPAIFHAVFRSFFASTMSLYRQQYGGMGDCRLMAAKSTWDYGYYWSVLAFLYFRDLMTDLPFLSECELDLQRALTLNTRMQSLFRNRAKRQITMSPSGRFIDQQGIPILVELNESLFRPSREPVEALRFNCGRLAALADKIDALLDEDSGYPVHQCELLGDLSHRLA